MSLPFPPQPSGSTLSEPASRDVETESDVAAARRALRVQLLKDLVSHGLYRVPTDELAERLVPLLRPHAG